MYFLKTYGGLTLVKNGKLLIQDLGFWRATLSCIAALPLHFFRFRNISADGAITDIFSSNWPCANLTAG